MIEAWLAHLFPDEKNRRISMNGLILTLWSMLLLLPRPTRAELPPTPLLSGTLPNGVRLLLRPETEPEIRQVAIAVFVRLRGMTAPNIATATMVSRSLFYGNRNRTQNGIANLASQSTNDVQVLTSHDFIALTLTTSPRQLTEATHFLCDCIKNAEFTTESLGSALKVIKDERARASQESSEVALQAVATDLGRGDPTIEALSQVTPIQAQTFYTTQFQPRNMVVSIAGRLDPHQTLTMLSAFLGDFSPRQTRNAFSRANPSSEAGSDMVSPSKPQVIRTVHIGGKVAYAVVGTTAPTVTSPDYPAFTVLESLLGGGHASRLFIATRERLGIGYKVGSSYRADEQNPLVLSIQWDPERLNPHPVRDESDRATPPNSPNTIAQLLTNLLDEIASGSVPTKDLERARNYSIGRDAIRHEQLPDRAFFPGWYETMGLGAKFDTTFPSLLASVTADDLKRVANIYLLHRSTVLILPSKP